MIRVPGVTDNGMRSSALVELIDIFPTITELAGLEVPPMCSEGDKEQLTCVEGTSLTPLLKNPNQQWKKAAFSQYPRPCYGIQQILNEPPFDNEHGENVMGFTVRVNQYHFTEWYRFNCTTATPNLTDIWGTELLDYDHTEPTVFFNDENTNMTNDPDKQDLVNKLCKILQAGWRAALPPSP